MLNPDESKLRLRRLNTDVHNPCYLLHIHDVNLLLDCCLDLSNLSYFLPNHQLMSPGCSDLPEMCGTLGNNDSNKEVRGEDDEGDDDDDSGVFTKLGGMNYMTTGFKFCMLKSSEVVFFMSSIFWETIDVILISNTRSILGLPFLFENTKFRGKIFTTEPVVKFGKILIDDLLNELEQLSESQVELNSSKKKQKKTKIKSYHVRKVVWIAVKLKAVTIGCMGSSIQSDQIAYEPIWVTGNHGNAVPEAAPLPFGLDSKSKAWRVVP
ncbi:unnamed protein product [Trichobilharzia regenti]|nr:unnamed protein product [Trichobilharzia regenti]